MVSWLSRGSYGRLITHLKANMMSRYAVISSIVLLLYFEGIHQVLATAVSSPPLSASIPSTSTHHPSNYNEPFNTKTITNFLSNRCGNTNPALWSYEGKLTDPASGKVIAEVEGLEIVKALPVIYPSPSSATTTNNNIKKESIFNKLYANRILYPQTSTSNQQWDSAVTILSRKIFCYRNPRSIDNKSITNNKSSYNSLLTSVRLRPDGPIRHLSPEESIAMYDSAVTYISRNNGKEMIVFSERPDIDNEECIKNYVMGTAKQHNLSSITNGQSTVFDFAIHGQKGISDTPMLPPLKQLIDSDEVVISPPRSRLLQFGKGDGNISSDRKYGSVRETYTYTFDHIDLAEGGVSESSTRDVDMKNVNRRRGLDRRKRFKPSFSTRMNQIGQIKKQIKTGKAVDGESVQPKQPKKCSVRYTRYGEAPPWYAPGRSCTLELQGKRMDDNSSNVPTLASWVATKCNFWSSGWPTIFKSNDSEDKTDLTRQYYQLPKSSESELAQRAVELFCTRGEQPVIKPLIDEWPVVDKRRWISSVENGLSNVQTCLSRLSKSFIVSE